MLIDKFVYRLLEHYYDWRFGIRTYAYASAAELGLPQDCFDYVPVPYRDLFRILKALPQDVRGGVLVDIGSGLGRVIIAAQRMGFKNPIGVEFSGALCARARENAGNLPITVLHQDATEFPVPPDATVFFFAASCAGEPLRKVLNNIEESVRAHPRPCVLAAYMIGIFEKEAGHKPEIVREICSSSRYPKAGWAIYRWQVEPAAAAV